MEWCYKNDDVWIIEAKGSSNNIDKYAPRKFEALKDYASRHLGIKWGFVRVVGTADLYVQHCLVGRCNKSKCVEADRKFYRLSLIISNMSCRVGDLDENK